MWLKVIDDGAMTPAGDLPPTAPIEGMQPMSSVSRGMARRQIVIPYFVVRRLLHEGVLLEAFIYHKQCCLLQIKCLSRADERH